MDRKPNMSLRKTPVQVREPAKRIQDFAEVSSGYTVEQARTEAERCLNCPAQYCMRSCPLHVPIPEFIAEVRQGNFEKAHAIIRTRNCMPGISGRACPQEWQCERDCTRAIKGEAVAIGRLERFVADAVEAPMPVRVPPAVGRRVAVVGSGPAGLRCARALAEAGCAVTLLEAQPEPGGITAHGIPEFVVPAAQVRRQLEELRTLGVDLRTGVALGRDCCTLRSLQDEGYQAIFVGIGAGTPVLPECEGACEDYVVSAMDYLVAAKQGNTPKIDGTVVVVGGGNTALDAARTAVRCGADRVVLMYRRTEAEMPARREEIQLAREEGIELMTLAAPLAFERGGVTYGAMELTTPDYPGGRRNVAPAPGTSKHMAAELVILALGFVNEPVEPLETDAYGRILTDEEGRTSMPGVFAGGDAVSGPSTLMLAAAAGVQAAEAMLAYIAREIENPKNGTKFS